MATIKKSIIKEKPMCARCKKVRVPPKYHRFCEKCRRINARIDSRTAEEYSLNLTHNIY